MKKPFDFSQMSGHACPCGKLIKLNLVARKMRVPERCYKCHVVHEAKGGHIMQGLPGVPPKPTFKRAPAGYAPVGYAPGGLA